jgi:hypothetical protein
MKTIKYNYSKLSQGNYLEKLGFIMFCLKSNANFPDLPIALDEIDTKKTSYETELDKSKKGDHEATTKAGDIRKEIDLQLKKNGIYINFTANGDEAKLESSGYDLAQERTLSPKPEIKVEGTNQPGEAKVFIRKVEKAVAYQVLIAKETLPGPGELQNWLRQPMTTRTYQMLNGLEALVKYYLIYTSVSPEGEAPWSEPINFTLLK